MESNAARCQEQEGGSSLGEASSCVSAVLAGGRERMDKCVCARVCVCVCVCHVRFSSSVNAEDYFLRDQNWLPGNRPPSIFSCYLVRCVGCGNVEAMLVGGWVVGCAGGGGADGVEAGCSWAWGGVALSQAGDEAVE